MRQSENDLRVESAEFARLDSLVASLNPRHLPTRQAPVLDNDAPGRLAALWQGIGISAATVRTGQRTSLSATESRKIMAEIFEEWFDSIPLRDRWGVDADDHGAAWERLPTRFRVVEAAGPLRDMASSLKEVVVTDESADDDDPPVLVVLQSGKPVFRWHDSYVQWQVWTLLRRLIAHRSAAFDARSGITGSPVLPTVYPWLEQLAEGVWRLSEPGLLRTDTRPAVPDEVFYRSPSDYFAYARSLEDHELAWLHPPGPGKLTVSRTTGSLDLDGPEYRRVPRERPAPFDTAMEAIGRLDGANVWIRTHENADHASVFCASEDRETIGQALAELGERVIEDATREVR
jgi:hypothetical protein